MGITMKRILEKYSSADTFSLTCRFYNYDVTDEEFLDALDKIEEHDKMAMKKWYEDDKEKFVNYSNFEQFYNEIKQECYDFVNENNNQKYINDYFHCSYITDQVGKTTKYGYEHKSFFLQLYRNISMNIDRLKAKDIYCTSGGIKPLEQIPDELKQHFLKYKISYYNPVTSTSGLMINYFFQLNEDTKKYLCRFRNDYCVEELVPFEDFALYKDKNVVFCSCTHERFNSHENDYKNMSVDEILDFINDEFFGENNDDVVELINKLVTMEVNSVFSFKKLGVSSEILINKVCAICYKIGLHLLSVDSKLKLDGKYLLCNIDEKIEKVQ